MHHPRMTELRARPYCPHIDPHRLDSSPPSDNTAYDMRPFGIGISRCRAQRPRPVVSCRLTQKSLSNLSIPPPAYSISLCLPHSSIYTKNHPHHARPENWRSVQKSLFNSRSFNTNFTLIHAAGVGSSTASQYAEPCSGKQPILDAFVIRSIVPRACTSIRWPHGHHGDTPTSWKSCLSCCRVAVCIAPCRVIPDVAIAFGSILY